MPNFIDNCRKALTLKFRLLPIRFVSGRSDDVGNANRSTAELQATAYRRMSSAMKDGLVVFAGPRSGILFAARATHRRASIENHVDLQPPFLEPGSSALRGYPANP